MANLNKSFLPANPGFYIVQPIEEDNKIIDTVLIPVVAWALDDENFVSPISILEVCENNPYPILTPSGSVIDIYETVYDSIQAWMIDKNGGV